ncbi:MAG TPA: peptide ABC transporter substrate-binding protein [Opitutaceae bacterium]|nr:peptide ABC transporter substrate-binding protein [Opitutaceae bacterium]
MRLRVSFVPLVWFLAMLGAGCTRRETPVAEGLRTHTLLLGNQNEPADLDPHVVNAYTDMNILVALFEGLTVLDEKTSQGLPGVAERWDVSPDALAYTFHLRADARWSNGDPVTARDFAFAFQRILTPAFGAEYSYMLWPLKNAEAFNKGKISDFAQVGVDVVDDRTLRLRLERPTPYLPSLVAHPTWLPLHRATLEKFGAVDKRGSAWTRPGNLVSDGPFTLAEWSPNSRLVVTKNPHYWDAAHTQLEKIVFFPIEKNDVEEHDFRAGQLHLTYELPMSKIPAYRKESPALLRSDPLLDCLYVNFNVTRPPLDNVKVRRALALAIDRTSISHRLFYDVWPAAHALTPPDCGGYTARAQVPDDFAAARELLAAAGFPGGRGLPTMAIQVLNDANQPRIAEALQEMWARELGVHITIEPYEQKTWLQNQQTKTHSIGLMGWVADFADPVTFLSIMASDNGNNWTGWANKTYDQLLDQAANTADPAARFEIFQRAEALMLDDAPIAPLINRARTYLIQPTVKNWDPSPLGVHRYQRVRLE